MKAKGKLLIVLLCVLIACIAWNPGRVMAAEEPCGDLPTCKELEADADLRAAMEKAWADSKVTSWADRHEEGGWILQCKECKEGDKCKLMVVKYPQKGTRDTSTPGPPPKIPCCRVLGTFHTHPNPEVDEKLKNDGKPKEWEQGPSEDDKNYTAGGKKLPGIVVKRKDPKQIGTEENYPEWTTECYNEGGGALPHTPKAPDASIEFVTWTINGKPVEPGTYRVPRSTIIDVQYKQYVDGTPGEVVSVNETSWLKIHYVSGEYDHMPLHVVNHPGAVFKTPSAKKVSQNATVDGIPVPTCTVLKLEKCKPRLLDVETLWELAICTNYTKTINWLHVGQVTDEEVLFDVAAFPGDEYSLISWACVELEGDENAENDCTVPSPGLIIQIVEEEECDRSSVAAGFSHTVGLKADGTVVAVGDNTDGQCNAGGWTDICQVAAGGAHTVGLKSDGTVVAVGSNIYGQRNVGGWSDIIQVAAGDSHTVGLKADGTVVGVGSNTPGQCNVGGWTDICQVAAGWGHTLGLKSDGTVVAVGYDCCGQCDVGGWTDITQVAAGAFATVGLKSDGTVVTTAYNVGDWADIVQVAAGAGHMVGLKSDGTVVAVGENDWGQCDVGGWSDIVQIAAGSFHTVGLKSDGTVVAVGNNESGQRNVGGWMLR